VGKRLGSRVKPALVPRPETPPGISEAERAFMADRLDRAFEARLGYRL
jgi:hypothetical protein